MHLGPLFCYLLFFLLVSFYFCPSVPSFLSSLVSVESGLVFCINSSAGFLAASPCIFERLLQGLSRASSPSSASRRAGVLPPVAPRRPRSLPPPFLPRSWGMFLRVPLGHSRDPSSAVGRLSVWSCPPSARERVGAALRPLLAVFTWITRLRPRLPVFPTAMHCLSVCS